MSSSSASQADAASPGFSRWLSACGAVLQAPKAAAGSSPCSRPIASRYPIHSQAELEVGDEKSYEELMDQYQETAEDIKRRGMAEQWKDELLRTSPMIRFMTKHLTLISCSPFAQSSEPGSESPIRILSCPDSIAGGFSPGTPRSESAIVLCANRFMSKKHMEQTLSHEMIHWWDHCRFNVDWQNLRHHACSEIRAASLSGDCSWTREIKRRNWQFTRGHQACVKRRAAMSVESNPACPDRATADRVVEQVFSSCFADTRPFDEIY